MTARSELTGATLSIDFGDFGGSGSFGGIPLRSSISRHEPPVLYVGDFALVSIFDDGSEIRNAQTRITALPQGKAA